MLKLSGVTVVLVPSNRAAMGQGSLCMATVGPRQRLGVCPRREVEPIFRVFFLVG